MIRQRILVLMFGSLLLIHPLDAGGPIYSRFGIGDLHYFGGSRSYALGGASVGLFGDGFINRMNPAGLAGITSTRFSGTFEFADYSSTDLSGSARYAYGDFGGLAAAIPVSRDYGVVIVGELTPYSTVRYAVGRNETDLGITSNQEFFGSGGISRFDFGASVSVTQQLHLGAKVNYLAGTNLQTTNITFTDNTYSNNKLTLSDHYSGAMFTFGATFNGFGTLLNAQALQPLAVGVVVETPTTLDLREQHFAASPGQYDTTSAKYGSVDVPLFLAVGASYTVAERFTLAGDLAVQDWSSAKVLGVHPSELRNSMRIGAGIEMRPRKDASTYLEHVTYRAGFYYSSSYIQLNNQGIDALFGTAGLGLPIGPDSQLNLGLQVGVNGTTSNGLQKDTIVRFTASISGSELWFIRLDED